MATVRNMKMRITTDDKVYPGMKKFKVHGKELSRLPRVLFDLLELEYLDLSPERETCLSFGLVELPKQICRLPLLKILVLDTNQIRHLPEEICMLTKLEKLTLSNNFLTTLPRNFGQLHSLTSLHCANNRFVEMPGSVASLRKLQFLDFSSNRLANLPDNIGELTALTSLILSYNNIRSLPESICRLRDLRTLWLSGNCLSNLPRDFGKLRKLDWEAWCASTVLDENPLQSPPLRIAKLGSHAIDRYFERQQNKPLAPTRPDQQES